MLDIFELAAAAIATAPDDEEEEDGARTNRSERPSTVSIAADRLAPRRRGGRTVLVCGSVGVGKSTLIAQLCASVRSSTSSISAGRPVGASGALRKNNETLPIATTTALQFIYVQRRKQLADVWELGGGGKMAPLIDVLLTPNTAGRFSAVMLLDLIHPEEWLVTVRPLLDTLRRRVDDATAALRQSATVMTPRAEHFIRAGAASTTVVEPAIRPVGVPLAILAARYDQFRDADTERKRNVYRLLRALAHLNGASVSTLSTKTETLLSRGVSTLSHFAFGGRAPAAGSGGDSADVHSPLFVAVGSDSLQSIDLAQLATAANHSDAMNRWYRALDALFPQRAATVEETPKSGGRLDNDPLMNDPQFAEPLLDGALAAKTRSLELYARAKRGRRAAAATTVKTSHVENNGETDGGGDNYDSEQLDSVRM